MAVRITDSNIATTSDDCNIWVREAEREGQPSQENGSLRDRQSRLTNPSLHINETPDSDTALVRLCAILTRAEEDVPTSWSRRRNGGERRRQPSCATPCIPPPCHATMPGSRAAVGPQSPQPHLEDGSVYRQNRPTM